MRVRVKKRLRLRSWVIVTFIIFCLINVLFFSYKIILWKLHSEENKKIQKKIEKNIEVVNGIDEDKKYNIDFKTLKEKNPDTIAYIKVNNTKINYVVVKGVDNKYYLNHNFEKKRNVAGWIFGDYHNKFDESDKNIIIYGHNIKDGSMFGSLIDVLDEDWPKKGDNQVILITEKGTYNYQVFSTYSIVPEDYYINTNFNNDNEFLKFIKKLKSRSIYDYGVDISSDDKILTLSSCIGEGEKRVVLHAKLIKD